MTRTETPSLLHEPAGKQAKRFGRPVLGRSERHPRVQADDRLVAFQSQRGPGPVGRRLVLGGGAQLELERSARTAQHAGQGQVVFDDGRGQELAGVVARRAEGRRSESSPRP